MSRLRACAISTSARFGPLAHVFRRRPPPHLPRHLLFRVLAYRLQADLFGDLDSESQRLLDRSGSPEDAGQRAVDLSRRTASLRPGTVLGREWNGQMQRVAVLADGFAWNGKTYPSLSKVAFAITGTRWNGPKFFGLRDKPSQGGSVMKAGSAKPVRCAIYTRVSTDQGLDQDFNSLDAQYDASQAYIRSQAHAGWTLLRGKYDDGGFSGGNTDRPALQRLLQDVTGRQDRRDRRLQGGPSDPLVGGLRKTRRIVRHRTRCHSSPSPSSSTPPPPWAD